MKREKEVSKSLSDNATSIIQLTRYAVLSSHILEIIEELGRSRTSMDEKILMAYNSLRETSRLVEELDTSLRERTERLNILRQEYERYSKLAEIEEEKASVPIQQLEYSLGKGRNRDRLINLVISLIVGFIIFFLGIFLSPMIRHWIGIG